MTAPIRVLIADDHPIVRRGIASVLATQAALEVVGEAADGVEAVRLGLALVPDVVLMDLRMPRTNGVDAIAELLRVHPRLRIVVLTTYASDSDVLRAIEAGAVGYLLKDVPHDELFRALRAVARGERYLAPFVTERLMVQRGRRTALTARETEVLRYVARGAANRVIASRLGITEPTVKAHLVHVFEKLGVENRTAAVRVAMEQGIIGRE
jgi:DNA-binding NarL/FixJ family response regulator